MFTYLQIQGQDVSTARHTVHMPFQRTDCLCLTTWHSRCSEFRIGRMHPLCVMYTLLKYAKIMSARFDWIQQSEHRVRFTARQTNLKVASPKFIYIRERLIVFYSLWFRKEMGELRLVLWIKAKEYNRFEDSGKRMKIELNAIKSSVYSILIISINISFGNSSSAIEKQPIFE